MDTNRSLAALAWLGLSMVLLVAASPVAAPTLWGQQIGHQPLHFQVSGTSERLEMIVNTSRIVTTEHNIPRLLVENESVIRAKPISPNQVQVSALKAGFTTLTVWDERGQEHSIDVLVYGDARELENLLMTEFPDASLRVRPLASSVVITGYVPRAEMVGRIIQMAEDYYPNVINNITVGGVQQVLLHVKLMEVSRTKLRKMGFDWAAFSNDDFIVQNAAGLLTGRSLVPGLQQSTSLTGETIAFGIVDGNDSFFGFLEALRQYNLVKVLAEPNLVTISGRPASFQSGGEFPIIVPQSLGTVSIEYRQFGTRVDFVPIVLGNGRIRLEVRPQVSEIDPTRSVTIGNLNVPGLRTRWVDTAVELNAGQTLALAGLIQNQIESENKGIPWLADLPWVGGAFRRVEEQNNEVELLIMVTPEFVEAVNPEEVPRCGPGEQTMPPNDVELYFRGYLEVPCCSDGSCANCQQMSDGTMPAPVEAAPYQEVQGESARVDSTSATVSAAAPTRVPTVRQPRLLGPLGYDSLD